MKNGLNFNTSIIVVLLVLALCIFITAWILGKKMQILSSMYLLYVIPEINMCIDAKVNDHRFTEDEAKSKRDEIISVTLDIEKSKALARLLQIEAGFFVATIITLVLLASL